MRLTQRASSQACVRVGAAAARTLSVWGCFLCRLRLDRNQPGVVDARPGQRIRLTCRAEGFPPPTIEWQRDGQLLSSPRHQLQPDGSLVISHVAVEDDGFYACVAFNGRDRDQRWVQLRVLGKV